MLRSKEADAGEAVEEVDGGRRRAEPVGKLGKERVDLSERGRIAEAVVDLQAERGFADVRLGQARVIGKFHFGFNEGGRDFSLERVDGALEELAVEVEADGGDLARLLRAEDVAGAADLEVAHGDFHPAAVA